jgi:hypothetical protein
MEDLQESPRVKAMNDKDLLDEVIKLREASIETIKQNISKICSIDSFELRYRLKELYKG